MKVTFRYITFEQSTTDASTLAFTAYNILHAINLLLNKLKDRGERLKQIYQIGTE